jgi:hypothetical protein
VFDEIVSTTYPFDHVQTGVDDALHRRADVTKCVIRIDASA